MKNKGKGEYVRWMESAKSYVEFDWHVVQFINVCLPSLDLSVLAIDSVISVYLVAQYARPKMKIMDAELGEKRKEDEKKEKEEAQHKALKEEAATMSYGELMEMKERLAIKIITSFNFLTDESNA
ncbi:predicted protein [Arabidopsis lyrata subsp. lyrata]|uniref:Predicted protein n=1 Tax=Arabidopsis lyrata subsp. lyrata TaxID=81972 RepID=D7KWJ9_ARALL|nr:predicted protein [Arabidopsis lyrata subsp. lyrata]